MGPNLNFRASGLALSFNAGRLAVNVQIADQSSEVGAANGLDTSLRSTRFVTLSISRQLGGFLSIQSVPQRRGVIR